MVEYPSVIREGEGTSSRLRLFYCGNGYGQTGIGTAVEAPLRAIGLKELPEFRITAPEAKEYWICRAPDELTCADGEIGAADTATVRWKGPTGDGMIWYESEFAATSGASLRLRVIVNHREEGLEVKLTATTLRHRRYMISAQRFPSNMKVIRLGTCWISEILRTERRKAWCAR